LEIGLTTENQLDKIVIKAGRIMETADINKSGMNTLNINALKMLPEFLGENRILSVGQYVINRRRKPVVYE
jgi:hypothetical protein